jgi:DNA polymerase
MATKLWIDTEDYSEVPIKNGTHAYAEKVEVLLVTWAVDDGPVQVWDRTTGEPMPAELVSAYFDPTVEKWAHKADFDRTVLRWNGCEAPIEEWRCTMVQAMSHSLPGGLDQLCEVLGMPPDKAKLKTGKALIRLFCMPQKFKFHRKRLPGESAKEYKALVDAAKEAWPGRATRETHPAQWAEFVEYAKQDIEAMREAHKRMPKWNYPNNARELALWHLDQRINDRGILVDLELAEAAVRAVDREQLRLAERTVELTEGEVRAATQRDAMLEHIANQFGYMLDDLRASTLLKLIDTDENMPRELYDLLITRIQASTTSVAKYKTLLRATSSDGRLRGTLQFAGAGRTARWAGRLFQPQNLPRPSLKQKEIDQGVKYLKADCADLFVPDVMELTSSAIRGCIIAPPNKKLVVADLSNIEGRMLAWLAGEEWKLQAFRDYDTVMGANGNWITGPELYARYMQGDYPKLELDAKGEPVRKGHDLYKMSYGKSFGIAPGDVDKDGRQIGKVQELALGYEGGVGAFLTFARAYAIDLESLADKAAIPPDIWEKAQGMLEWHRSKGRDPDLEFGLSERAWLTCESIKTGWREAHPNIAKLWKDSGTNIRLAIENPGKTYAYGKFKARRDGNWLRIALPSGRCLCYPFPEVDDEGLIWYRGVNQFTRKWCRLHTYGGKTVENKSQAASRDIICHNMPLIDSQGYELILTVHDEDLTETPDRPEYNVEHLSAMLARVPKWAEGLPLAAAGFETARYRKD